MLAHTCVGRVSTAKAMNMACQIVTNCTACTTYTVATTTGAAAWCRHAWLWNTASHTTLSLSVGARISVRHYVSKRKKKWNERNSMMMSNLLNTEWKKEEAAQQQGPLTHVNMLGGTEGSTRSSRYKCPAVAAQCRVVWIYVELRTQWRWPCQQEHLQGMHNALQKHWSTGIAKGLMKFKPTICSIILQLSSLCNECLSVTQVTNQKYISVAATSDQKPIYATTWETIYASVRTRHGRILKYNTAEPGHI